MDISNPYLSIEISESQFKSIKDSLRRELKRLFNEIQELSNPHISIAYVLGKRHIKDLENLAQEISEGPFEMNINGIKLVDSRFYDGTIVSLSLEHTDDFIYLQEFSKEWIVTDESVIIKEDFPGGFQAHLSLFILKDLDLETKEILPLYLETALAKIKTRIFGERFTIYDDQREKLIQKDFVK